MIDVSGRAALGEGSSAIRDAMRDLTTQRRRSGIPEAPDDMSNSEPNKPAMATGR